MSRADFFLVVSADVGDLDPDDVWVKDAVTREVTEAMEDKDDTFMSGPWDVRVIDARKSEGPQ